MLDRGQERCVRFDDVLVKMSARSQMRGGRVSGRIRDLRFSTDPVPGSFFKSVGLDYINISYPFGLLGIIEKSRVSID